MNYYSQTAIRKSLRKRLIIENYWPYRHWKPFRIIFGNFYGPLGIRIFFLFIIDFGYFSIKCKRRESDIKGIK